MKIIFLDIDGVLNNRLMYDNTDDIIKTECGLLSKTNIALFNSLVEQTNAKVVLSSTWRHDENAIQVLKDAGIIADFVGITPSSNCKYSLRGNEICGYIKENIAAYDNYHSYIILDDDSDMLLWQRENFFHVDNYVGLTPNIVYKAARFLARF